MTTFHLIAHTHWDREWYLTRGAFTARLVPMLDDLIDRLERDPALRTFHLDGQSILLRDYLAVRPENEARVARLVEAGRLETGPWYILADEVIPAGESLIQNLLLGARDARRLGGRPAVCYSPDAFGHPAVLPDLAAQFGLPYAVVWRGVAARQDLFRWEAPGGGSALTHHLPPQGYEVGAGLPADARALQSAWPPVRDTLTSRAATSHVAVFVGADHHAVHRDLPGLAVALRSVDPAHEFRISSLEEFFVEAEREAGSLGVVRGEQRASYGHTWTLQGTHGTRAHLKRRNALVEMGLGRIAAPLAALAHRAGGLDRGPLVRAAWRTLVEAHFHDTLCGTCADEVARAMDGRLTEAADIGQEIVRGSIHDLVGHDPDAARDAPEATSPRMVLWNPLPRPREGEVVTADMTFVRRNIPIGPPTRRPPGTGSGYRPTGLATMGGEAVPVQVLDVRPVIERLDAACHYPEARAVDRAWVAFRVPPIHGLSILELGTASPIAPAGDVIGGDDWVANDLIRVQAEADGTVTVSDLRTGEAYAGLLEPVAERDVGDTYTFCPAPGDDDLEVTPSPCRIRSLAGGPLLGALEVSRSLRLGDRGVVVLRAVVSLAAGSPALQIRLDIDNQATDCRVRMAFPVGVGGRVVAGAGFGVERRGSKMPGKSDSMEAVPATAPAHRFVGAAQGGRGLVLLAPGFFEYEWTYTGTILATVFRAVGELSKSDLPTRPGHAAWPISTPEAQCPGGQRLEWTMVPIDRDLVGEPERLHALWESAFLGPRAMWIANRSLPAPRGVAEDLLELGGDGLVVSTISPPEGAGAASRIVLRCWNIRDTPVAGTIRSTGRWHVGRAVRVRADEREEVDLLVEGGLVRFTAEPHALVTLILEGETPPTPFFPAMHR